MTSRSYTRPTVAKLFKRWKMSVSPVSSFVRTTTSAELAVALDGEIDDATSLLETAFSSHPFTSAAEGGLDTSSAMYVQFKALAEVSISMFTAVRTALISLIAKRSISSFVALRKEVMCFREEVNQLTESHQEVFVSAFELRLPGQNVALTTRQKGVLRSYFGLFLTSFEEALTFSLSSTPIDYLDDNAVRSDAALDAELARQSTEWMRTLGYVAGWLLSLVGKRGKEVGKESKKFVVTRAVWRKIAAENSYVPVPSSSTPSSSLSSVPEQPPAPAVSPPVPPAASPRSLLPTPLPAYLEKIARISRGGLTYPGEVFFRFVAAIEIVFETSLTTANVVAYAGTVVRACLNTIVASHFITELATKVMMMGGGPSLPKMPSKNFSERRRSGTPRCVAEISRGESRAAKLICQATR